MHVPNKSLWNHICILTYLAFIIISIQSCSDEEVPFVPENEEGVVDIGEYFLLPESISQLPYFNQTGIVFIDSLGDEVVFDIIENELRDITSTLYKYNVIEVGDTVMYKYTGESISFVIENDVLDMQFNMSLSTQPYYTDPEMGWVADVLNIFCVDPSPDVYSRQVFYHVTDDRTWPTVFQQESIEEIDILGQTFFEVWNTNFSDPKSVVNYNYELGIVSFTDMNGKLWRFKEFI